MRTCTAQIPPHVARGTASLGCKMLNVQAPSFQLPDDDLCQRATFGTTGRGQNLRKSSVTLNSSDVDFSTLIADIRWQGCWTTLLPGTFQWWSAGSDSHAALPVRLDLMACVYCTWHGGDPNLDVFLDCHRGGTRFLVRGGGSVRKELEMTWRSRRGDVEGVAGAEWGGC